MLKKHEFTSIAEHFLKSIILLSSKLPNILLEFQI